MRLRELTQGMEPNEKLPTSRQLTKMFDVSYTTLAEALTILEQQDMLYRKQGSGIYISPHIHRRSIGVLCYSYLFAPDQVSPFWGMLWGLIAREAQQRLSVRNERYSFHMLLNNPEDAVALSEDFIALVLSQKMHAVLAIGMLSPTMEWLEEHGVPSVTFAGRGSVVVCEDDRERDRLAIKSLAEQGCRRIGSLCPTIAFRDNGMFFAPVMHEPEQYLEALFAEYGLPLYKELIRHWELPAGGRESAEQEFLTLQEQGYSLTRELFCNQGQFLPDGLYIPDDMMTFGAVQALQELGLHVGKDIKVATQANARSPILFGMSKAMTLVEFDPQKIVSTLFTVLDHFLVGKVPEGDIVKVKPVLITCS